MNLFWTFPTATLGAKFLEVKLIQNSKIALLSFLQTIQQCLQRTAPEPLLLLLTRDSSLPLRLLHHRARRHMWSPATPPPDPAASPPATSPLLSPQGWNSPSSLSVGKLQTPSESDALLKPKELWALGVPVLPSFPRAWRESSADFD